MKEAGGRLASVVAAASAPDCSLAEVEALGLGELAGAVEAVEAESFPVLSAGLKDALTAIAKADNRTRWAASRDVKVGVVGLLRSGKYKSCEDLATELVQGVDIKWTQVKMGELLSGRAAALRGLASGNWEELAGRLTHDRDEFLVRCSFGDERPVSCREAVNPVSTAVGR